MKNFRDIILHFTDVHKPDALALQELNIRWDDDTDRLKINGYQLITDSLRQTNGLARAGLLIRDEITCNKRDDLINHKDAHVCATIHQNN